MVSANCPHPAKVITGIYSYRFAPVAVSWHCQSCDTDGSIPWASATPQMRKEAGLAELARQSENEMHVWRADG